MPDLATYVLCYGDNLDIPRRYLPDAAVCRHADTPHDIPWHRSDEFAPRANADEVADLAKRLARRLKSPEAGT